MIQVREQGTLKWVHELEKKEEFANVTMGLGSFPGETRR
jgi:hypothetical protein